MFPLIPPTPPASAALPHCGMAYRSRIAILFITNSESGQANTILTLAAELLSRLDNEVHVASFAALEKHVAALRGCISGHHPH